MSFTSHTVKYFIHLYFHVCSTDFPTCLFVSLATQTGMLDKDLDLQQRINIQVKRKCLEDISMCNKKECKSMNPYPFYFGISGEVFFS